MINWVPDGELKSVVTDKQEYEYQYKSHLTAGFGTLELKRFWCECKKQGVKDSRITHSKNGKPDRFWIPEAKLTAPKPRKMKDDENDRICFFRSSKCHTTRDRKTPVLSVRQTFSARRHKWTIIAKKVIQRTWRTTIQLWTTKYARGRNDQCQQDNWTAKSKRGVAMWTQVNQKSSEMYLWGFKW